MPHLTSDHDDQISACDIDRAPSAHAPASHGGAFLTRVSESLMPLNANR